MTEVEETPRRRGLAVRKLADRAGGERVVRFDPETGAKKLVNPATPGDDHEPWPLLGVVPEGELPKLARIPTSFVDGAVAEGWAQRIGERVVHRAGGTEANPWSKTHTFVQCDKIVFHFADGDVVYLVTYQPDKYAQVEGIANVEAPVRFTGLRPYDHEVHDREATEVRWFYDAELES